MSQTWRVIKPEIVGNPERGYEHVYYWHGGEFPTREEAISHGWSEYGHDDWLLLRLYDDKADRLFWMQKERDDFDELAAVARTFGKELTHVATALAGVSNEVDAE